LPRSSIVAAPARSRPERSRPQRNWRASPTLATRAVATIGPTPGSAASRRESSFCRQSAMTRRSRLASRSSRARRWSTRLWNSSITKGSARPTGHRGQMVTSCRNRVGPCGKAMPYSSSRPRVWLINAVRQRITCSRARCNLGRFADGLGIARVVLGALDVGPNEPRVDQPDLDAKVAKPSAPMVGAATGFHRDHRGRELDNGLHQPAPADAPRHNRSTMGYRCHAAGPPASPSRSPEPPPSSVDPPVVITASLAVWEGGVHSINPGLDSGRDD
jgi:hypothetical protein